MESEVSCRGVVFFEGVDGDGDGGGGGSGSGCNGGTQQRMQRSKGDSVAAIVLPDAMWTRPPNRPTDRDRRSFCNSYFDHMHLTLTAHPLSVSHRLLISSARVRL